MYMTRYAFKNYKTHYACLPCRYTLKAERKCGSKYGPRCPHCRERTIALGHDFHAPRRQNVTQWRKVALLVHAGYVFDSYGGEAPGYRPRTLADAKSEMGLRRTDGKTWVPKRETGRRTRGWRGVDKYWNRYWVLNAN